MINAASALPGGGEGRGGEGRGREGREGRGGEGGWVGPSGQGPGAPVMW